MKYGSEEINERGEWILACMRYLTEQVLANVFAVWRYPLRFAQLQRYINYMRDVTPTYVVSDFSENCVQEVVDEYPDLYRLEIKDSDGILIFPQEKLKPRLDHFNSMYPEEIDKFIRRMTKSYVEETWERPHFPV